MLDLGPRGRTIVCAVYFGSQALLIATAGMRSDRSYGFRMFLETSSITLHVLRRIDGDRILPIEGGRWQARDCSGTLHDFRWGSMVRFPAPAPLDVAVEAPYGVESEFQRTDDAILWVAEHTPADCETRALVAHAEPVKNGHALAPWDWEVARAR